MVAPTKRACAPPLRQQRRYYLAWVGDQQTRATRPLSLRTARCQVHLHARRVLRTTTWGGVSLFPLTVCPTPLPYRRTGRRRRRGPTINIFRTPSAAPGPESGEGTANVGQGTRSPYGRHVSGLRQPNLHGRQNAISPLSLTQSSRLGWFGQPSSTEGVATRKLNRVSTRGAFTAAWKTVAVTFCGSRSGKVPRDLSLVLAHLLMQHLLEWLFVFPRYPRQDAHLLL